MDTTVDIVQTLKGAASQLTQQRYDEIQQHRERLEDLEKRSKAVELALESLSPSSNGNGHQQGISEDRLKLVREYIAKHPKGARQATVAKRTGLNSGTVSVGLRRLEEAGLVERADRKENGSQVWVLKERQLAKAN